MKSSEKYDQFKAKIQEWVNDVLEHKEWDQCIAVEFVQLPANTSSEELKDHLRIGYTQAILRNPLFPYELKEFSYGPILLPSELDKFKKELEIEGMSAEELFMKNRDNISAKIRLQVEKNPNYRFALTWDERRKHAQKGAKIETVTIQEFLNILKNVQLNIRGNNEVYFVGENGDGKSLILMAIHLTFNGNYISRNESNTAAAQMALSLNVDDLNGTDTNHVSFGMKHERFIDNFYTYGANRGLASSDRPDESGYMSLYSDECRLFHPVKLLTQMYLNETEKKLIDAGEKKVEIALQNSISLIDIERLFHDLLDQKVKVKTTREGVIFVEKGMSLTFNRLSDGFKNILIWISDLIYRLQLHQPSVHELGSFDAVVMVDEIELHLHPSWQNDLVKKLRKYFKGIQFIFTTHSPSIIQGASNDAMIYRVFRDPKTGTTSVSEPYFKKDMTHMMYNTLVTSPLFGLESARISPETEEPDTSDSFLSSRVAHAVSIKVEEQKAAGKTFISRETIDRLIQEVLNEELNK